LNTTNGIKLLLQVECMVQSHRKLAVKIDTLVSRTFLNSILMQIADSTFKLEMPSRLQSEWNGQWMSSSHQVVQHHSSIDSVVLLESMLQQLRLSVFIKVQLVLITKSLQVPMSQYLSIKSEEDRQQHSPQEQWILEHQSLMLYKV